MSRFELVHINDKIQAIRVQISFIPSLKQKQENTFDLKIHLFFA